MKSAFSFFLLGSLTTLTVFGFILPIFPSIKFIYALPDYWWDLLSSISTFIAAMVALFTALFSNYSENKRRREEKRNDAYTAHRNTIVQIEHELIPYRFNLSKNLESLKDATKNTNQDKVRLILRFYRLNISNQLSLKLLNLDLINKYSEMYSLTETVNSDLDYMSEMVAIIRQQNQLDQTLLKSYTDMLPYLFEKCEEADQKSLELLAYCQAALSLESEKHKDEYMRNGDQMTYNFDETLLRKKRESVLAQEQLPFKNGELRPKFFSPFLDIVRVYFSSSPFNQ